MKRPWLPTHVAELKKYVAAGLSVSEIGRKMKRPNPSVTWRLKREGLAITNKRLRNAWTPADVQRLLNLRAQGVSFLKISVELHRDRSAVSKKLQALEANYVCRPRQHAEVVELPVAESDWMKPLTKAQLMAGRA